MQGGGIFWKGATNPLLRSRCCIIFFISCGKPSADHAHSSLLPSTGARLCLLHLRVVATAHRRWMGSYPDVRLLGDGINMRMLKLQDQLRHARASPDLRTAHLRFFSVLRHIGARTNCPRRWTASRSRRSRPCRGTTGSAERGPSRGNCTSARGADARSAGPETIWLGGGPTNAHAHAILELAPPALVLTDARAHALLALAPPALVLTDARAQALLVLAPLALVPADALISLRALREFRNKRTNAQ